MVVKFRAWDRTRNEWSNSFFIYSEGGLYTLNYGFNRKHLKNRTDVYPIVKQERFILMQSTGLFDVNGKEIFEGDIVVNKYGNVGYVAYLQQEAGFVVVLKKSDYRLGHRNTGESYDVTTNHEIIGNIHQNPELLEAEND